MEALDCDFVPTLQAISEVPPRILTRSSILLSISPRARIEESASRSRYHSLATPAFDS